MTMRMSAEGRAELIRREGFKLKAYRDSVGVWTIGVGHTSMAGPPEVTPGLTITAAECDEILSRDLIKYEGAVNIALKRPVSQQSFDALVSLCFNIGAGGFSTSTVVKRINAGDLAGAGEAFLLWNKPPEIRSRRRSERDQFVAGLLDATEPDRPLLRIGDEGEAVARLQRALKLAGSTVGVDGKFGPVTKAAVERYQRSKGLKADGIVGERTWRELLD